MTHHLVGMAEIAEMLGVTRQRVSQLIESYDDFPKPEVELSGGRVWARTAIEAWIVAHPEREPGRPLEESRRVRRRMSGGLFSNFTDLARQSIPKAQEAARLMNHNYIGTEHLLLGLLALEDGVAYKALTGGGITLAAVRETVLEMIGRGSQTPQGHIPFTPRSKKVLELSMREALQLGHSYIGTEHVLLALVREGDGVACQALEKLGIGKDAARKAVIDTLQGYVPARSPNVDDSVERCSFCGKSRQDVHRLIAGPGVYICDECIALGAEIVAGEHDASLPSESDARTGLTAELREWLGKRFAELEERIAKLERPPNA